MARIRIHNRVLEIVREHAQRAAPLECCGVLLGRGYEILQARPVENLATDPDQFEAAALQLMKEERRARRRELIVSGYYHSHPTTAPAPSAQDRKQLLWPDLPPFYHLIYAPGGEWVLYNTKDGAWSPLPVEVVPDEDGAGESADEEI